MNTNRQELPQLPAELLEQMASQIKTEHDLSQFANGLMKQLVERTLKANSL